MIYRVVIVVICIVNLVGVGNSYKILGLFPTPSISHQVVFRGLTLALNKRGHELVVLTTDPVNDPTLKNYTEIDIGEAYTSKVDIDFIDFRLNQEFYDFFRKQSQKTHELTEHIFENSEMRKLYSTESNETFDLVLVETLFTPGIFALAKRFNAPIIGITSLALPTNFQYAIGNPIIPSYHGNWELGYRLSERPTFWQRLENFFKVWRHIYWYQTTFMPIQQEIARTYLGNDVPDLREIEKNVSLVFVNQQGPISYNRPNNPNIIDIGGFHVSKKVATLPKDLERILDGATNGFIYMSLGSNVKSVMLPNRTMNEFINAFSRLPYKVLWKFENDVLPNKPDNIHIMKWVPQQAVLAHPNLKVFIYQGGLQSTEEAVAHAVPLIGFPVFADQDMQVNKMVSLGVAMKLEITAVDGNELLKAITTVATDPSYKQKMLNLRSLIEDRPHDPLENAVWWTEYVIRHNGAPHLRSGIDDAPWYSRQDMDVVAFTSFIFTLGLSLVTIVILRVVGGCHKLSASTQYRKKKLN